MLLKKAKEIQLSPEERSILQYIALDPRTPESLVKRMKIILMAVEGQTNHEIEHVLHLSHGKAKKWRNRYAQKHAELVMIEEEAVYKMQETIVTILSDAMRRGGPSSGNRRFIMK